MKERTHLAQTPYKNGKLTGFNKRDSLLARASVYVKVFFGESTQGATATLRPGCYILKDGDC